MVLQRAKKDGADERANPDKAMTARQTAYLPFLQCPYVIASA